jgi:hypothetical protein
MHATCTIILVCSHHVRCKVLDGSDQAKTHRRKIVWWRSCPAWPRLDAAPAPACFKYDVPCKCLTGGWPFAGAALVGGHDPAGGASTKHLQTAAVLAAHSPWLFQEMHF